jgi:hypothetical protein
MKKLLLIGLISVMGLQLFSSLSANAQKGETKCICVDVYIDVISVPKMLDSKYLHGDLYGYVQESSFATEFVGVKRYLVKKKVWVCVGDDLTVDFKIIGSTEKDPWPGAIEPFYVGKLHKTVRIPYGEIPRTVNIIVSKEDNWDISLEYPGL